MLNLPVNISACLASDEEEYSLLTDRARSITQAKCPELSQNRRQQPRRVDECYVEARRLIVVSGRRTIPQGSQRVFPSEILHRLQAGSGVEEQLEVRLQASSLARRQQHDGEKM